MTKTDDQVRYEQFMQGLTLKDGPDETERLAIPVTAHDIARAKRNDIHNCVVAKAASRIFGVGSRGILIYKDIAYVDMGNGEAWRMRHSKEMSDFIERFDKRRKVEPTVLWLNPVSHNQTLASKRERRRTAPRTTRKVRSRRARAQFSYRGKGTGFGTQTAGRSK
jgi:hypothetical protein